MTNFNDRDKDSKVFEQALFDKIRKMGFDVAINGTEHTCPVFVDGLRQSNDQTSLAIRFQPDCVANIGRVPRSFYVEAKAAKTIERLAYEQYLKLYEVGNIAVVVFEKLEWRWGFVEELVLEEAEVTVGRYPKHRRFPIVDGWIAPRVAGRKPAKGSGTQYRMMSPEKLRLWRDFKKDVIERLKDQF